VFGSLRTTVSWAPAAVASARSQSSPPPNMGTPDVGAQPRIAQQAQLLARHILPIAHGRDVVHHDRPDNLHHAQRRVLVGLRVADVLVRSSSPSRVGLVFGHVFAAAERTGEVPPCASLIAVRRQPSCGIANEQGDCLILTRRWGRPVFLVSDFFLGIPL
jgi:hypothetical protein